MEHWSEGSRRSGGAESSEIRVIGRGGESSAGCKTGELLPQREPGESRESEPLLCTEGGTDEDSECRSFGLSLPVGPRPREGRFAGGRLRA